MAQIKVVFLMHDVDQFNGAVADKVYNVAQAGFQYPEGNSAISVGKTKQELCDNLRPGSDNAKACFGTKVHANADAAKSAMGINDMDVSDASSHSWELSGDGKELSLTCNFDTNADADSFQTKLETRDPYATQGLVWQDHSKAVWNRDE